MSMKQKLMITLVLLVAIPVLISVAGGAWFAKDIAGELLIEQAQKNLISIRVVKKRAVEDYFTRIRQQIRAHASPRHVPAKILQVADIPRTLNGKIAELAVRNVIENRPVKNRDALANPDSLELFQNLVELRT